MAILREDADAALKAIQEIGERENALVSLTKQLESMLVSTMQTLEDERQWSQEFLRRANILDPVFTEIILTAETVEEDLS